MNFNVLKEIIKSEVRFNEQMKKYTTFQIGGIADAFVFPEDLIELKKIILFSKKESISYFVIGNGSNILVKDEGIRGIVISLKKVCNKLELNNNELIVGSGLKLNDVLTFTYKNNFSGLEFLIGIPGTIGGAIKMNAGIREKSISEIIKEIYLMDENGNIISLPKDKVCFGYRQTFLPYNSIILETKLELQPSNKKEIKKKMEFFLNKKKETQPLNKKSAGCVFKNPIEESAGYLIDKAGLKGTKIGDAMVSLQHANFIVNENQAKAKDVLELIEFIKTKVKKQFNINLELEIKIIG